MDIFSCHLIAHFTEKNMIKARENSEYAEMRHGDVLNKVTSQIDVRLACGRSVAVSFFILPTGWYGYMR